MIRKIANIIGSIFAAVLILLITVWILIHFSPVQTWLVQKASQKLSEQLHTKIEVRKVDFSLFKRIILEGVYIEDQQKDTLLYAGRISVRFNNWFIFKNKAIIHDANIEHAKIFLHRKDSTWNYNHIVNYFSSGSDKKGENNIHLSLQKINLYDIKFLMRDEWVGEDIKGYIGQFSLLANRIELDKKIIDVKKIIVNYPECLIYEYNGKRPPKRKWTEAEIHAQSDTLISPFLEGWKFDIAKVDLREGKYSNILDTIQPYRYFDPSHIVFNNINASLDKVTIKGDSIQAKLFLSTKERSGFEISKLFSSINWHARAMEFHQLEIHTPYSFISDYFSMRYLRFNHDFNRFIDHVYLEGNFINSKIHSKDLAYFAPIIEKINDHIYLNGRINGKINNLSGHKLTVKAGKKTLIRGNADIKGLPNLDNLSYNILLDPSKIDFSYLSKVVPEFKNIKYPNFKLLGDLGITGRITGKNDSIIIGTTLQTNIGKIRTDLKFHFPKKRLPSYNGMIQTDHFNIGKFINIKEIGAVNMKLALSGSGLEKNNANINLNSQIASLDFNNIDIQDIQIDASFKKESLRLSISTIDKNVNANLSGIINLNQNKRNHYIFGGSINKIDLYNLGLFNTPLSISTNVNADFSASDINDYNGLISLNNINISDNEKFISFKDLAVSGITSDTGTRSLSIHSDFLNFKLNGIYTIDKLNSLGNQILAAYFPSYFHNDKIIEEINDFSFDLETNTIDDLLSIFKIPIHGANASRMSGKINTKLNEYKLEALIPNIYFGNIGFNDIHLESNNDNNLMKINGDIGLIELSDSLKIPNTQFLVRGAADTGFISIKTAMNQTFRDADLRTYFKISKEGILFNFLKSNFVLNEKIWSIENESDLFLSSKNILSDGIILSSGNESIKIFTHPSDIGSHNDITIEVRKLELGEILPFFLKDPIIEGTTTGRIDISDPFGKLYADVKLTSERFRINDDSIGLVPLQLTYNQSNKTFKYTINSENQKHIFNIKGYTNITKLDSIYTDNNIQLSSQSLALIEPYLDGIISNINGSATGLLNIRGYLNDIKLSGSAKLNNASFILDYTQCKYSVQAGAIIEFTENKIDFVNMLLKDIKGKSASFSGKITHSFFNDMFFDLHFEAMNKNKGILVLNTTAKDNSLFYGNVTAYANGTITGPVNNIKMKIMGRPTDSSKLFLPTSDSRVTGTASFIVFRQYGEDLRASSKLLNTSSVNVDLDVIANPYAKVYLILDEVTNDIIEGQGNGAINLKVGTHEKVSITGNYEIISGKYTFNWQYLFKRPFLINKGVINWSGDPYDARINIDANYMVEQVRLPNELTNGCSNERNNILVVANLSNTLKNPSIKFKFELPQGHPCRNNPLTNNGLTQLYNNPDELNRQVISLLLIGSFISNSQNQSFAGGSVGNTFVTSAAGTLSEFLAQQVESGLGAVIRNIPGLKDLKLDPYVTFTPGLITGTQAEGIGFQGTGSFGFTRRLMNGKLLLKAGGSMLVATGQNNNTVQNNRQLTPDISIEWLITPDGKLRLIGFYRTIFDIQRRNDRTGVSFSYLKEFDKIW